MYSTRLIQLLVVAFSAVALTHAAWLDLGFGFIGMAKHEVAARQASSSSTGSAAPPKSSTGGAATSPSTSATKATTTSATPTPSSIPSTTAASPTPTPTTAQPSATTTPGTDGGPTTSDSSTGPASPTTPTDGSSTEAPTPVTSVIILTTTDSAGNTFVSSTSAVITPTGSLASTDNSNSSGMTAQTRNTIIGVCAGVGGAIVLAVAGVFFWRLRRKRSQEGGEDLVNYGAGTSQFNSGPTVEKSEASGSTTGRSPFQSTLESYHAPTQSNTGTNF